MIGYRLLLAQKDLLVGQQFAPDQYFNPVPDINGDYFIFDVEVNDCVSPEFQWVKDLPEAEYIPPIIELWKN